MNRKGKKKKGSGNSKEALTARIQTILSDNPHQGFNYKQVSKRLNINEPSE
jgi:hypothetical protein